MLSFRKTPLAIRFFDKSVRGGEGRLYLEKLLFHSDENTRRGLFCAVFKKLPGSEKIYG